MEGCLNSYTPILEKNFELYKTSGLRHPSLKLHFAQYKQKYSLMLLCKKKLLKNYSLDKCDFLLRKTIKKKIL
jgi:hypothetical protein